MDMGANSSNCGPISGERAGSNSLDMCCMGHTQCPHRPCIMHSLCPHPGTGLHLRCTISSPITPKVRRSTGYHKRPRSIKKHTAKFTPYLSQAPATPSCNKLELCWFSRSYHRHVHSPGLRPSQYGHDGPSTINDIDIGVRSGNSVVWRGHRLYSKYHGYFQTARLYI